MRYCILQSLMIAGIAFITYANAGTTTFAADCDRGTPAVRSACEAANKADSQGPYRGPKAATVEPMVCLYALNYEATELVLVEGSNPTGPAIRRWRPSAISWRRWSRDTRLLVGEICIPAAILRQYSVVTLCNGKTFGEGNHSTWRSRHLRQLLDKRRIPERDPACLLGKKSCGVYGL